MRFVIYGFDDCPFCQKAYALLTKEGIPFTKVTIVEKDARTKWMDEHGFVEGERTFPRIYREPNISENYLNPSRENLVGGYTDLEMELLNASL